MGKFRSRIGAIAALTLLIFVAVLVGKFTGENVSAQNSTSVSMQVSPAGTPYMATANGAIRLGNEIGAGSTTLGTTAVSSGTCSTAVSVTVTGVLTTDNILVTYASSPTGVADKGLFLEGYPTANAVNIVQCNATAGSITPTGLGVNYSVIR